MIILTMKEQKNQYLIKSKEKINLSKAHKPNHSPCKKGTPQMTPKVAYLHECNQERQRHFSRFLINKLILWTFYKKLGNYFSDI